MTVATLTDKKTILRDKRAQGIAAMGLVNREGDRFRVTTPSLRGRRSSYEVWRDETGKVRCSCLEFEEQSAEDPGFRCEHILAVKHSLLAKNSEAVTKGHSNSTAVAPVVTPKDTKNETIMTTVNTEENASEKRAGIGKAAEPVTESTARFEREQNKPAETPEEEAKDSSIKASTVNSLAKHTYDKEHEEMIKQKRAAGFAAEPENEASQDMMIESEESAGAPVVPLAFANTLRTLRQPIDPRLIKTREGWVDRQGNTHIIEYVEWHTVADLLDRITPAWSHSVRGIVQIGDMVAITAAITVDGVTREGVGTGTADNETGIKKAEHDALKRAAIKFGIARDLYQRESEVIEKQGGAPQAGEFPRDPLAKSMSDLVTAKQLGMIRALGREAGIDVDDECLAVLRCRTEELSKRAASSFIDHLKNTQQAAAAAVGDQMRRAS